jgi:hypothetical protein
MAFAISEFKSNLKGGGAKSSLFSVELNYPTGVATPLVNSQFLVSAANFPASTVATYDVFYHGKAMKVASDRTYEGWETTIINDEDFGIRSALEKWSELLSNHELNTRSSSFSTTGSKLEGQNADYKQDISVTQFSKDGTKELQKYKFVGAFPIAISTIPLSWDAGAIETFTCSWAYDCWENQAVGGSTNSSGNSNGTGNQTRQNPHTA